MDFDSGIDLAINLILGMFIEEIGSLKNEYPMNIYLGFDPVALLLKIRRGPCPELRTDNARCPEVIAGLSNRQKGTWNF